jgi:hypothetical protein
MMRPFKAVGLGSATVLAALLTCAPVAAADTPHGALWHGKGEHKVLKLVAKTVQQTFIQQNPNAVTQGDRQVFTEDLFDAHGKKVGSDGGECVVTRPTGGGEAHCNVTLQLAKGQITSGGLIRGFLNNAPFAFDQAITGGTGEFDRVQGMLHGESVSPTETHLTIDLDC